jgi:hypothetical protein
MRVTSEFQAGESTYQVNLWHPDKAIENMTWLVKMIGEPVLALVVQQGSIKDLLDTDVDAAVLVPAVRSLVTNLHEKEVVLKVRAFTEGMLCDGGKVIYDTHFMGRPGHLIKVVVGVLKAQYADFFDALPAGNGLKSAVMGSQGITSRAQ